MYRLITGRTAKQGVALHVGKTTKEYEDAVAVAYFNEEDMQDRKISEGKAVLISSRFGKVVVKALKGKLPRGMVFMPYGPWANLLTSTDTNGIGMPDLKGIEVDAVPSEDEVWSWKRVLKEVSNL